MRSKTLKSLLTVALFFSAIMIFTPIVSAADIYVPDNYVKIQWAVDNATTGDIIIVRDGTYTENVKVNKSLTIRSEKGSAHTIVSAAKSNDNVISVTADYVNISGFAVKGASYASYYAAGICLDHADYCSITNNICSNNNDGIHLFSSNNNCITNNICSNNRYEGIQLALSNHNIITNNNCSNNKYGVSLSSSTNNVLYLNNFINNINNSYNAYSVHSINIWNSTEEINYTYKETTYENYLGNFWDDYTGSDADGDGIGDTHQSVYHHDNDNYPLMMPFEYYPLQYPDLMVEDIWIEPVEFNPGNEVKLYARIKNIGDADAVGKFWCNIYVDDTLIKRYHKKGLAAGDSERAYKKYFWPADCNLHTITVLVDADITESNEGNNERSETFSATSTPTPTLTPTPTPSLTPSPTPPQNKPDLTVTVVAWSYKFSLGQNFYYYVVSASITVKNIGGAPASTTFYTEYVVGQSKGKFSIPYLAPGKEFNKLCSGLLGAPQSTVGVYTDITDVILETNEDNNDATTVAFPL